MNYDKRSFLAGLATGRQLKGWSVPVGGAPERARITGPRMVHRGSRKYVTLDAPGTLTAAEAGTFEGVILYTGTRQTVALGSLAALEATGGEGVSGVGTTHHGPVQSVDLGAAVTLTAASGTTVTEDGFDIVVHHYQIAGGSVLPGEIVTPGISGAGMETVELQEGS